MPTAQTEVVGATTPIVPMASARYSSADAEAAGDAAGRAPGDVGADAATPAPSSGITSSRLSSPADCEIVTTLNIGARRDAKPPAEVGGAVERRRQQREQVDHNGWAAEGGPYKAAPTSGRSTLNSMMLPSGSQQ